MYIYHYTKRFGELGTVGNPFGSPGIQVLMAKSCHLPWFSVSMSAVVVVVGGKGQVGWFIRLKHSNTA